MAKPRIFVSSTYYDMKHIRASIENFIQSLGFESILSEKGNIAYNPDSPLDESCYHEVNNSDIFVIVVGGRYGSPSSDQAKDLPKSFYTKYESITKKEYLTAIEKEIPTYILIDKSVYAEYETFRRNRKKDDIEYAHVDSVNVFHLIDDILQQPRNNPVFQFDNHNDIEDWLKEQWSGLFRDLIHSRKEIKKLNSLSDQVKTLSNLNTTLKKYLEEIISKVSKENAEEIISQEAKRIEEFEKIQDFEKHSLVRDLIRYYPVTVNEAYETFSKAKDIEDLLERIEHISGGQIEYDSVIKNWKEDKEDILTKVNLIRSLLQVKPLKFRKK
ncbi:DUF4062 domain-containing protein [Allomuricauda sp. d1]|uniref:DUF4062 domain-containing protein n=1 Tax=Allomuricauda sp. d1 TaxID=3136725 RepID=UPI0031D5B929